MLSHAEVGDYYDRFGARQDEQSHGEDRALGRALDRVLEHFDLATPQWVVKTMVDLARLRQMGSADRPGQASKGSTT